MNNLGGAGNKASTVGGAFNLPPAWEARVDDAQLGDDTPAAKAFLEAVLQNYERPHKILLGATTNKLSYGFSNPIVFTSKFQDAVKKLNDIAIDLFEKLPQCASPPQQGGDAILTAASQNNPAPAGPGVIGAKGVIDDDAAVVQFVNTAQKFVDTREKAVITQFEEPPKYLKDAINNSTQFGAGKYLICLASGGRLFVLKSANPSTLSRLMGRELGFPAETKALLDLNKVRLTSPDKDKQAALDALEKGVPLDDALRNNIIVDEDTISYLAREAALIDLSNGKKTGDVIRNYCNTKYHDKDCALTDSKEILERFFDNPKTQDRLKEVCMAKVIKEQGLGYGMDELKEKLGWIKRDLANSIGVEGGWPSKQIIAHFDLSGEHAKSVVFNCKSRDAKRLRSGDPQKSLLVDPIKELCRQNSIEDIGFYNKIDLARKFGVPAGWGLDKILDHFDLSNVDDADLLDFLKIDMALRDLIGGQKIDHVMNEYFSGRNEAGVGSAYSEVTNKFFKSEQFITELSNRALPDILESRGIKNISDDLKTKLAVEHGIPEAKSLRELMNKFDLAGSRNEEAVKAILQMCLIGPEGPVAEAIARASKTDRCEVLKGFGFEPRLISAVEGDLQDESDESIVAAVSHFGELIRKVRDAHVELENKKELPTIPKLESLFMDLREKGLPEDVISEFGRATNRVHFDDNKLLEYVHVQRRLWIGRGPDWSEKDLKYVFDDLIRKKIDALRSASLHTTYQSSS